MRVLLVVNPISGGIDKEPFLQRAEEKLENYGIEYQIFKTSGEDDHSNLQKLLEDYSPDRAASLGGDGTTLFTALALRSFEVPIGIIPFGSANGMAKELGVDSDPDKAFSSFLMSHKLMDLDLIKINDEHYCMHIGDIGWNAAVIDSFEKDPNRGMITYAKHFLNSLSKIEPISFKLETNDTTIEDKGYMVALANSRKYGTGVILNYHGHPGDGRFEIVVVKSKDAQALLLASLSAFDEKYSDELNSEYYQCTSATLTLNEPQTLQLDGEVIGEFTQVSMEIVPAAIKLLTTKKNPFIS